MGSSAKTWKEAASVIILASSRGQHISRSPQSSIQNGASESDYRVLLLTRNHGGSFAGAHVFPGGKIDKADFSPSWLDLFADAGITTDFGALTSIKGPRPPMLVADNHLPVPKDIAFRICAIREAFEESGVLLLKKIPKYSGKARLPAASYLEVVGNEVVPYGLPLSDDLPKTLQQTWRHRVHEDASQFVALCKELSCVPDVWALAEWSNWLTPVGQPRRFDTMFYTCCLEQIPDVEHDKTEMIKSQWARPEEVLNVYLNGGIHFAGPQVYELLRISRFPLLNDLHGFIDRRAFLGCQRNCPKVYILKDGAISANEGDDLYPQGSQEAVIESLKKVENLSQTIEESRNNCRNLHRMEISKISKIKSGRDYQCNIKMPCGHISPRSLMEFEFAPKL